MGCWNGTCGLTNLPIMYGDEMYVFPIVESNGDSFCYSTALYRPSVLPFRAEYNDYGAGEKCTGAGLEILIDGIKEKLVEMEVGENQYHDIAVKRNGFDVDTFFDVCHESRLKFLNPMRGYDGYSETNSVFFTMIRKDVTDRLWSEWKFDLWFSNKNRVIPEGFESDTYHLKDVTYEKLATLIPDYMEKQYAGFAEKTEKYNQIGETDDGLAEAMIYAELNRFFETPYNDREHPLCGIFEHMFSPGYSDGGFAKIGEVKETIVTKYMQGEQETAYELLRECLIGYMVNNYMESVRKVWTPPMHQGSQSECLDEYLLLNSITNNIVAARKQEFEEYTD